MIHSRSNFSRSALAGAGRGPERLDDLGQHRLTQLWSASLLFAMHPNTRSLARLQSRVTKWLELPEDVRRRALVQHAWMTPTRRDCRTDASCPWLTPRFAGAGAGA